MADRTFRSGAPELEKVFESKSKKNGGRYCAVCLRSDSERRLVDNGTFKKFILAVNLENHWRNPKKNQPPNEAPLQEPSICYMCDRQAVNAFKFYRATHFASSINKIFMEIKLRDKSFRKHIFHKINFKKMLMQMNLDDDKILPSQWEAELKIVQRRSQLMETRTLVIDSLGVVTDNSDSIVNDDQNNFTTTILSTPVQIPKAPNNDKNNQTSAERKRGRPRNDGSKKKPNEGSSTRVEETVHELDEPEVQLRPINSNMTEFVITDDEQERDPLKVETISDSDDNQSSSNECPESPEIPESPKSPIITNAPKLVPIEKLLQPVENINNSGTEYILQPILYNKNVPTISAHMIDGQLYANNVVLQNGQLQPITPVLRPLTENTQKRKCEVATPSGNSDMATQSKRQVLPVHAKPSENRTIDWEDKIPMDVISFMDAVDPNYIKNRVIETDPNIRVVSSNDNKSTSVTQSNRSSCEVIDLC